MGLHVYVKFGTDADFTDITSYVRYNSVKFDIKLMNDKFKSVQDSVKMQTIYDATLNARFFEATTWMPAYITYDLQSEQMYGYDASSEYGYGSDAYGFLSVGNVFTGAIYPTTKDSYKSVPTEGVSFELVDNSYLLEVDCPAFTYQDFKVFDPANTSHSIIHQLLYSAGLVDAGISSLNTVSKTVGYISYEVKDETIDKIIDDILYEYHHTYYFNEDGQFCLYDWKHDSITLAGAITDAVIKDKDGIKRERNIYEFDGYLVKYKELLSKTNALIYREDIPDEGNLLIPSQAFPVDGEIKTIKQSYSNKWLSDDAKILLTSNHALTLTADEGITKPVEVFGNLDAQIVIKNTDVIDHRFYQLDIRADVVYTDKENEFTIPSTATLTDDELELEHIYNSTDALEFANALYNNTVRYGLHVYEFKSEKSFDVGFCYELEHYNVNVLLIGKKYNHYEHIFEYECLSVGAQVVETPDVLYRLSSGVGNDSPSRYLALEVDFNSIDISARGAILVPTITFRARTIDIPIANVSWSRSDAGSLGLVSGNDYLRTLDTSTVAGEFVTITITASYGGTSYSATYTVKKVYQNPVPHNFGDVTTVPNNYNGEPLIDSDYFLWSDSNTPAGSTVDPVIAYPDLVKGEIYEYNDTEWVQSTNGNLVMTMFDDFADLANDVDETVIGNAVIKKLVAIDAFIKNLNAENLTAGTGNGTIGGFRFRAKSRIDLTQPYDTITNPSVFDVMYDDRKVFEVDSESGNVMFGDYATGNGLRWENSTNTLSVMGSGKFTGTMDHEALTTMDAVASQISVNLATKTAYYGQDLYNGLDSIGTGAWVSATGTFDGIGFSRIARLGTTEQTAIIVDSSVPNDGELQFVSAYTGSVRFIFEARPGLVSSGTVNLYINGVLISSTTRNAFSGATVVTVDRNVAEGDIVKMTTSGNEIYFKMYIRGVGLVLDMVSRYVSIKTTHYYDDRFLSSSPVAIDSNSYMTYNSAEGIIGALAALTPNRDYPTVSGSAISVSGGVSKSVTSIMRSSETVIIKTSSGIVYLSTSIQEGVSGYDLSGIITVDTSEASLRTLTVLPKQDDTHSLGSLGLNLYYADLFVSSLVGMISAFASSAAPSGWLECNGQAVSRSTYSKLYTAIGTTFGSGDGSTTFNVPDLRGEFIRGWSHGRSGVDDGRAVGSFQDQSIQSHAHSYTLTGIGGSYGGSGSGGHRNYHEGATTGYAGGAETRPRNIALMYCIKY